ncbi:MAG: DUF4271 domain-containing protein [Bacteroidetes bacterium]|nr:DUF4271 domain-containing protein [Bacteroidota bacterium]
MIYAFVATYSRHIFTDIAKLLTFGASGSPEENYHGLFRWQSTLANLASFMSLSLVLYFFVIHFGTEFPFNARGPEIWFIILAAISLLVAIRHVTSAATGFLSESEDAFSEYLNSIYILYRALGLSVIPVSIAVSYVPGLPHEVLITTGIIIILLLFIFRIIRLLVIFLQSGVSIFYFILYLCALEILPGAILIKVLSS